MFKTTEFYPGGAVILVVCGLIGWGIGLVRAEWHWAIEHAQWMAGLAAPVDGTLGAALQSRLWSLIPQLLAIPLRLGIPEWWVTLVLTGLAGMVTCQALGMFTYAVSRHVVASVCVLAALPWLTEAASGAAYPVMLLDSPHSYGVFGLAVPVLALALLGAGWARSGALLLAIAPAIHLPLGVFAWAVAAFARPDVWHWRAFASGAALTGVSLLVHVGVAPQAPLADPAANAAVADAFARLWDGHRVPVDPAGGAFLLTLATIVVARLTRPRAFIIRVALVAGVAGVLGALCTWLPPESVPPMVRAAMPGRLMNLALLTWPALFGGLLARRLPPVEFRLPRWLPMAAMGAALAVTTAGVIGTRLDAPLSTPVWAAIAANPGPIATAGNLRHVQERTHRAVLLEGATLDALAYVPDAAVATRDVLREVYGIDLEAPPAIALGRGNIPPQAHRATWESRSREAWVALGRRYGITGVLTYPDWTLALPLAAADAEQRFYLIPK